MPAPDFMEAYLARRRQLETDRVAKEQFDREMQYRDATLNQQRQFHMETLAAQQAEQQAAREQRAKEFAENVRLTQEARQQQREFDLAGMAAKGEIRAPQSIEVPMAPGSTNPTLQGMPGGQVKEPGINFAGQNLVFTSPVERAEQAADVEDRITEQRRQRRFDDLEKLYKSGQIPEQMYTRSKVTLAIGQQPSQEGAEESYVFNNQAASFHKQAAQKAMEEGRTSDYQSHIRLAATAQEQAEKAIKWVQTARAAMYPPGLAATDRMLTIAGVHMKAATKELGFQPGQQLSDAEMRKAVVLARQKALEAGDRDSVAAADQVLGMPQNVKERESMFSQFQNLIEDAEEFKKWRAARQQGQTGGTAPTVPTAQPSAPKPQPTTQAPSVPPPTSPEQAMEQAVRLAGGPPWDPRADWSKFSPEAVKKVQAYLIQKGLQQRAQEQAQPARQPIQYR